MSILRKKQAYAQIANAKFTGRGKYRFHDYIHRHQHAHNTLEELGETVAETKKVTDFMNGITDPTLVQAKTVVNGDQEKLENFEACQQYFLTVHSAAKTETQDDSRKIAAASTTPSKGKGKGRNQKKSKKKKDRVHAGHYDADEWEVFDEALKYTMLANGQLAAAERRRNVCGRYSADLEFDVRDPNVSDKSANLSSSS